MDSSKRIAYGWMPSLYSRRNIKKSARALRTRGLNYFSRKAEWEASDQWTTRSLIYRRPKQTDRGTCIEFFIRIALVFFPSLGFFLKILARDQYPRFFPERLNGRFASTNESVLCLRCTSWRSYCYQFCYSAPTNTPMDTIF